MRDATTGSEKVRAARGSAAEVFAAFLKLGLTSFGGPIAHLGYFRDELVVRRKWIDEEGYADLVALCQFLPGPGSSQVGFSLGLLRGGPLGALAAWAAFTLPSAILMLLLAFRVSWFEGGIGAGILHGLKLVAVAIVAQAVWGMAKALTPDRERGGIALLAVFLVVGVGGSIGQVAAIVVGGLMGLWICRTSAANHVGHLTFRVPKAVGGIALLLFVVLFRSAGSGKGLLTEHTLLVRRLLPSGRAGVRRRTRRTSATPERSGRAGMGER